MEWAVSVIEEFMPSDALWITADSVNWQINDKVMEVTYSYAVNKLVDGVERQPITTEVRKLPESHFRNWMARRQTHEDAS